MIWLSFYAVNWRVMPGGKLHAGGASNLTVAGLFAALSEVFSKRGVFPRLLSKFWARDQEVGETLVAYSHSLMGILEEIAKADPGEVPDQSALLLKKFCAGVADQNLRWELKQQLRSVPGRHSSIFVPQLFAGQRNVPLARE